jgi:hypothetical protein
VVWNEVVDGEPCNNGRLPRGVGLNAGSNDVLGTTGRGMPGAPWTARASASPWPSAMCWAACCVGGCAASTLSAASNDSSGSSVPLGAGDHSLWVQDTGVGAAGAQAGERVINA